MQDSSFIEHHFNGDIVKTPIANYDPTMKNTSVEYCSKFSHLIYSCGKEIWIMKN